LHAKELDKDQVPVTYTDDEVEKIAAEVDEKVRDQFVSWARRMAKSTPFLDDTKRDPYSWAVWNTSLSKCFNCNDIAIWISGKLVYPSANNVTPPNVDMPEGAKFDYREAAEIVENSPRGAAALLRLAVQKLCVALGGDGTNLNADIGALVERGLDKRVQQALDIVRVTGNNAVHPGEMDLKDDRETAEKLFSLVNLITDVMISQPKQIDALYEKLPDGARSAVERRDKASAVAE
jgi:hypothetical protein